MAYSIFLGVTEDGKERNIFHPLDGDIDKVFLEDMTPDDGALLVGSASENGRRLVETHLPSKILLLKRSAANPTLNDTESYGMGPLVNDRFRELVEAREPGCHQFIPTAIYQDDRENPGSLKAAVPGKKIGVRYLFAICNRLDTMDIELTYPINDRKFWMGKVSSEDSRLVLKRDLIGTHHAWYDKFARLDFVSDALANDLQAAGISGIRLKYYKET